MKTGNELIADFMGYSIIRIGYFGDLKGAWKETEWQLNNRDWIDEMEIGSVGDYAVDVSTNRYFNLDECSYHTSWDWLMPVVENIHLLKEVKQVSISPGKTRIWFADHIDKGYIESPCKPENKSITECYLAVIDFLRWYNKNVKQHESTNN